MLRRAYDQSSLSCDGCCRARHLCGFAHRPLGPLLMAPRCSQISDGWSSPTCSSQDLQRQHPCSPSLIPPLLAVIAPSWCFCSLPLFLCCHLHTCLRQPSTTPSGTNAHDGCCCYLSAAFCAAACAGMLEQASIMSSPRQEHWLDSRLMLCSARF